MKTLIERMEAEDARWTGKIPLYRFEELIRAFAAELQGPEMVEAMTQVVWEIDGNMVKARARTIAKAALAVVAERMKK